MSKLLKIIGIEVFERLKKYLMLEQEIDLPQFAIDDSLNYEYYGSYYKGRVEVGRSLIDGLRKRDIYSEEYYKSYQRLVEVLAHEIIHHIQNSVIRHYDNYRLDWLKEFHANLGGYLVALDYFRETLIDGFIFDRSYKYSIINVLNKKYDKAMYDSALVFLSVMNKPEEGWEIVRNITSDLSYLNYALLKSSDDYYFEHILLEVCLKWKRLVNRHKKILDSYSTV